MHLLLNRGKKRSGHSSDDLVLYIEERRVEQCFCFAVVSLSAFLRSLHCLQNPVLYAVFRSYLYLGSILGAVLSYFTLASFLSIFLRFKLLNDALLWGGLFMYLG